MTLLDGKATSEQIKLEITEKVREIIARGGQRPHLIAILVGEDGASQTYVAGKERACQQVGFDSTIIRYPDTVDQSTLLDKIREINSDPNVHGLIVQLPLPKHIDEKKVISYISPDKDIDCLTYINQGKLYAGHKKFIPCTPNSVVTILDSLNINLQGKEVEKKNLSEQVLLFL